MMLDQLIQSLLLAIDTYTQSLNSAVKVRQDDVSPSCNADQSIDIALETSILQTQVKTQGEADRKMIAELLNENNVLRSERDRLKAELERKSIEWKQIKEKLRQRQTIRNILGSALEDEHDYVSSPMKPMTSTSNFVDLSEEDQTQMHNVDNPPSQDGIAFLAEAANSSMEKENIDVTDSVIGQKRKATEGHRNDCPCCVKYFQAVGQDSSDLALRHANSRHNYRQTGPGTPPGFWNVGFTQE